MTPLLVHATGLAALAFNVSGLVRTSDRSLRHSTGWASALWAANNIKLMQGASVLLSKLKRGGVWVQVALATTT